MPATPLTAARLSRPLVFGAEGSVDKVVSPMVTLFKWRDIFLPAHGRGSRKDCEGTWARGGPRTAPNHFRQYRGVAPPNVARAENQCDFSFAGALGQSADVFLARRLAQLLTVAPPEFLPAPGSVAVPVGKPGRRRDGAQSYAVETGMVEKAGASRGKRTAETFGGGAVIGTLLGAIVGKGKGAAIGGAIGAGAGTAVQASTKGEQVQIPPETKLDFTLKSPLTLTM
jgi:hypothetical protein